LLSESDHLICGSRLGKDIYGGAWCPKEVIAPGVREWIEIDLHREYRLTRTATQVNGMKEQSFQVCFSISRKKM